MQALLNVPRPLLDGFTPPSTQPAEVFIRRLNQSQAITGTMTTAEPAMKAEKTTEVDCIPQDCKIRLGREDLHRCGVTATLAHMTTVASRDLRNHTADVLRQVADGNRVTVTVNGRPVAEISPVRSGRKQFLTRADLTGLISTNQADPGLAVDLQRLAGETTDQLDS